MVVFEGKEVSTFIKNWEMDCEEYGLNEVQKCKKFPPYCTKEIGEAVEKLRGYDEGNWELFKKELKQLFWQDDPPKNSIAALVKLIGEAKAGRMTVDMYVLKYTAITQELVDRNAISTFDRNVRLLEGLSEGIQSKVFEHCSDRKWRMLEHDVDTEEPKFEDLKEVVLAKARTMERKHLFISGRLSGMGYASAEAATSTPTASTAPSTIPTAMTSPSSAASDLKELTEQISRLTLLIGGQSRQIPGTAPAPIPAVSGFAPQRPTWVPRCMYCDSLVHTRRSDCPEFQEALGRGVIGINEKGRVKLMATGEELPLMFGKGGMKVVVQSKLATGTSGIVSTNLVTVHAPQTSLTTDATTPTAAGVATISFDDRTGSYGVLGKNFDEYVRAASLNPGKEQWIDVEVEEKRKRGDGNPGRRVRQRADDSMDGSRTTPANSQGPPPPPQPGRDPAAYGFPPPVRMEEVRDEDEPMRDSPAPAPVKGPKFRLASELNQTITTEDVGRKVMDAPIQLKMCELLAVSTEVSSYLHDQTRRRRIPLENGASNNIVEGVGVSTSVNLTQLSTIGTPLYACPSARTKVSLNEDTQTEGLLDDGSELNLMAKELFDRLQHPIDTDINWRINGYDSKAEKELEELEEKGNLIGVCHGVLVGVGGVEVKQHIFVVHQLGNTDLILGRPWERMVRAQKINMDDGSYKIQIKSLDGTRKVEFIAVPVQHERIREFVRPKESQGVSAGKGQGGPQ
jgi:hypothetical protein